MSKPTKTIEELTEIAKHNLCWYDERWPGYKRPLGITDEGLARLKATCFCANCHNGRAYIANCILECVELLNKSETV